MTTKSEIVIRQFEKLPEIHSKPLLQFKDWLIDDDFNIQRIDDDTVFHSYLERAPKALFAVLKKKI